MRAPLLAATFALLSCTPPAPPPPVVNVPAPPPPAVTAAETASPTAEPVTPPPEDPCTTARGALQKAPRATAEDCVALLGPALLSLGCERPPEVGIERAAREMVLYCLDDVMARNVAVMLDGLAPEDRKRVAGVGDELGTAASMYCSHCGFTWVFDCGNTMRTWLNAWAMEAAKGELTLEPGAPRGYAIRVFGPAAERICALPKTAWKGQRVPADCRNRVLATLLASAKELPGFCGSAE